LQLSRGGVVDSLPIALLAVIFVVAAAVIWVAGIQLSAQTDVLSERLHLGTALGGLILLAIATNLPEIAITVSAAASGDVSVAVGNILGGIAIQTVVLVVLDIGVRGDKPLTFQAARLSLLVEAAVVIAVLGLVVAGTQIPSSVLLLRVTPEGLLVVAAWVVGLILTQRASKSLPWHSNGDAPGGQSAPRGHRKHKREQDATKRHRSTGAAAAIFGVAALATLVAGVALELSGDAIAKDIHLSGVLFGATILALATSLPEISTGLASVKSGDFQLAMSDIFGGNAFLPVLFFVATLISGKAVIPQAHDTDIYLTALAVVLTLVYLLGILFRPRRRIARMGVDSIVVLVLYALGVAGLFAIASA
jgi:cation:H+ antiporter